MKRLLSARQLRIKEERRRRGNTYVEMVKQGVIKTEFTPSTKFSLDKEEVFQTRNISVLKNLNLEEARKLAAKQGLVEAQPEVGAAD